MGNRRDANIIAVVGLVTLALFTDILHDAGSTLVYVSLVFILVMFNFGHSIYVKRENNKDKTKK